MPAPSAIERAAVTRQRELERTRCGTITIELGGHTSSSIIVALDIDENAPRATAMGQMQRMEPCVVHVRKELLPSWATVDAMAGHAKVITDDKTFKVSGARDLGHTLRLSCFRWPGDSD